MRRVTQLMIPAMFVIGAISQYVGASLGVGLFEQLSPVAVAWLRGAGAGGLGVVTSMEIALVEVSTVYAGNLFYPAADAEEIIRRFRDWAPAQSEELTSAVAILNLPPTDDVPAPLRGRSFAVVRGCWSGDLDAGRAVVDEWREWRTPVVDMWGALPFAAIDAVSMDPTEPMPVMVTTEWFDDLPDVAVDIVAARVRPAPASAPRCRATRAST